MVDQPGVGTAPIGESSEVATDPEWMKLIALARSARARVGARQGAAVRDETGRTHAAVDVDRESLRLSAVQLAVATALATGARGIEAAVEVGADGPAPADLALLREAAAGRVELLHCGIDGKPVQLRAIQTGPA